ncbi:MAG: hypothetical protein B9S37_07235 [Verrucomicrobiia bacterium Tous-C3TDCM]|nr:MAG: hypothetical protein B9S37_07235 [Verrucomicrobiae bacterium Tous-C3TDCM]PAZ06821.1 MAG: hypothetical protein CAK88_02670 [Verrucomicrobiae bacterium AMD-G2]
MNKQAAKLAKTTALLNSTSIQLRISGSKEGCTGVPPVCQWSLKLIKTQELLTPFPPSAFFPG